MAHFPREGREVDSASRQKLETLALKRLAATAEDDDGQAWSFLFYTDGSVSFSYCPWSATEDLNFSDDGDVYGLKLPWSPARKALIESGKANPDAEELHQWRQAMARDWAANTDRAHIAWIVPIWVRKKIKGYALFLCGDESAGLAEDEGFSPELSAVFDNFEEAIDALRREGPVNKD
ncbi:MAG: hypothetical protein JW395_2007 [Nitrospira sp.]|nr:hypothetical protein [Nitrospira sp.]